MVLLPFIYPTGLAHLERDLNDSRLIRQGCLRSQIVACTLAVLLRLKGAEMGSGRVQPKSARCLARDFVKPDRSREELTDTRP
jgi:hypothetical protein